MISPKPTKKTSTVVCGCGTTFYPYKKDVDKGGGKYCSPECRDSDPERKQRISKSVKKLCAPQIKKNKAAKRLRCRRCDLLKAKSEFVKDKTRPHGYFPWCKSCHVIKQTEYSKVVASGVDRASGEHCLTCLSALGDAHPNREYCSNKCKARAQRWRVFGISPNEFRQLTVSGKCPLCGCNVNRWVIDHNHDTGETTGPVCQRCNQYLLVGSKHNAKIAASLLEYLTNPPVRKMFGTRRYVGPTSTSQLHRTWLWTGTESTN